MWGRGTVPLIWDGDARGIKPHPSRPSSSTGGPGEAGGPRSGCKYLVGLCSCPVHHPQPCSLLPNRAAEASPRLLSPQGLPGLRGEQGPPGAVGSLGPPGLPVSTQHRTPCPAPCPTDAPNPLHPPNACFGGALTTSSSPQGKPGDDGKPGLNGKNVSRAAGLGFGAPRELETPKEREVWGKGPQPCASQSQGRGTGVWHWFTASVCREKTGHQERTGGR